MLTYEWCLSESDHLNRIITIENTEILYEQTGLKIQIYLFILYFLKIGLLDIHK